MANYAAQPYACNYWAARRELSLALAKSEQEPQNECMQLFFFLGTVI